MALQALHVIRSGKNRTARRVILSCIMVWNSVVNVIIMFIFVHVKRTIEMRLKAKNRIFIAWLLLVTFMPLFMVKALHHHGEEDATVCHTQDRHSHPTPDHCSICKFTLSPFTQGEIFRLEYIALVTSFIPGVDVREICLLRSYPYQLRAPPFC